MREGIDTLPIYRFDQLKQDMKFDGPGIIVSNDTTIFVDQKDTVTIDRNQNMLIDINTEK